MKESPASWEQLGWVVSGCSNSSYCTWCGATSATLLMTLSSIFTHDGLHVMSKQILFATSFRGSQWHFLHQRQHHGFNLARCVSSRRLQRLFRMRSSLRSVFLTTSSTTILGSYSRSKLERTQRRWMLNTPTHGFGERDRPGDYVTGSGSGSGRRSSNEAFVDQVVRALTEHCGIRGGDKVSSLFLLHVP